MQCLIKSDCFVLQSTKKIIMGSAFEFNKCCFCIDLRSGCLIIGYLNLIGNIILILLSIIAMATTGVANAIINDNEEFKDARESMHVMATVIFAILVIMLIFYLLFLAFTIVLLVGLHQHKRGHIKAYLIYALIFIVLSIIMFFASFGGTITAGEIIRQLVLILLNIYFVLVIRSYYLKMDDPSNKPAVYNTA
ncbi:hypothetical protein PYW07_012054 [Mythimna separata]|uniref:Uncharacterized protein n=1 Tax=Mythimna separata TaxID=271217 RepID=A0AAD7YKY2_MYTSE|nr:hypothetical protein PYW07_012054 [Mythimna separata]